MGSKGDPDTLAFHRPLRGANPGGLLGLQILAIRVWGLGSPVNAAFFVLVMWSPTILAMAFLVFNRAARVGVLGPRRAGICTGSRREADDRNLGPVAHIGAFGLQHRLTPLLADFAALHPRIQLEISFEDRKADLIGEGYDMAVRIGTLADSSLITRRLSTVRAAVVASPIWTSAVARHSPAN